MGIELDEEGVGERNSIQVIGRAAEILRQLKGEANGLSLGEVSKRTGMARSTVQRIVKALVEEDLLAQSPSRGGVVLGPGLLALVAGASLDVRIVAKPYLEDLARAVDETVDLSMLREATALFVEHIAGSHRLAALSSVGTEFPLHSTANGKALLACVSPESRAELLTGPLKATTRNTSTDVGFLESEIQKAIRTGLAFDLEEHTEGVCAIGTAFLDQIGQPYAISIPVPRQRFDQKKRTLEEPLLECRRRLVSQIHGTFV